MNAATSRVEEATDLSLVMGGPLYQAYLRCRLVRPPIELVTRRIIAFALITWVPLAILSAVEGRFTGGVDIPFLENISAHVRFLLVLPLMIVAEVIVHRQITRSVKQFEGRGLVAPEDEPRFNEAVTGALRLRNSAVVEVMLIVLAITVGFWLWKRHIAMHTDTWYAPGAGGAPFTMAGYWLAFVSLPLFRFLMYRWHFRVFVWYRFLWKVSRIPLRLNALHPDRAGGLGFLDSTPFAFLPVLLAPTALLSAELGDRILHLGATLPQFQLDIVVVLISLLLLVYLPLMFFVTRLYDARWKGRRDYGGFAVQYVADFREKWIKGPAGQEKGAELGSGDIQSLADLANSFQVADGMRVVPFSLKSVSCLGVLVLLPLAPLLFTMMPVNEMINRLIKLAL
jgi:hypothetical protein